MKRHQFISGSFVLFSILCQSLEGVTQQEALGAVSSLRYFVGTQDGEEPAISCTETELTHLWEVAREHPLVTDKVTSAQHFYLTHTDQEQMNQLLTEAWQALQERSSGDSFTALCGVYRAHTPSRTNRHYPQFDDNPFLTQEMRDQMRLYLLPVNHVSKPTLDTIFGTTRVTQDQSTLTNAGFHILFAQPVSFIKVVSHPELPGYLMKLYLDNDLRIKRDKSGWQWLVQRCDSARQLRDIIHKYKIRHFVVPHKWLYPLPAEPSPPATPEYVRQPVALLVQRMPIVNVEETRKAWRTKISKEHLKELYIIFSEGYGTAYIGGNIPYCNKGLFAIVDTEYGKRLPKYNHLRPYLSQKMYAYWEQLVRSGGRPKSKH